MNVCMLQRHVSDRRLHSHVAVHASVKGFGREPRPRRNTETVKPAAPSKRGVLAKNDPLLIYFAECAGVEPNKLKLPAILHQIAVEEAQERNGGAEVLEDPLYMVSPTAPGNDS